MRVRGCLPAALLGLVSVAALLVALGAGMTALGCCSIDCEKFPEQCAINAKRQRNASLTMLAGFAVSAAAMAGAVRIRRRG